MDKRAIESVEKHILGTLYNCEVSRRWLASDSLAPHLPSLAKEICGHKKQWLRAGDVYSEFFRLVGSQISKIKRDDESGNAKLEDLIGKEGLQDLATSMVAYFVSIPRPYELFIQVPTIAKLGNLDISDDFSIVTHEKKEPTDLAALFVRSGESLVANRQYLRYRLSGYCRNDLESQGIRLAFSNFKIAFQQAIAKELLSINRNTRNGLLSEWFQSDHRVEKTYIVCADRGEDAQPQFGVELPLNVSRLLTSIELDSSNGEAKAADEAGSLGDFLKSQLRLPSLLMSATTPEANRVRAAIEWSFNSEATESETLSFLQVCIGLEALLGEEVESEGITKTLADRCAYLIGTSVASRTTIRERFRDLYKTRSKIVHGGALALAENEAGYLDWGRSVLTITIFKELRHLGLGAKAT